MSVIDDLLATMTSLSGNKNVVFIFDPKQYEPVGGEGGEGSCAPTSLTWEPSWSPSGNKVAVLAYKTTAIPGSPSDEFFGEIPEGLGFIRATAYGAGLDKVISGTVPNDPNLTWAELGTAPADLAGYIFLYSGVDLMRQKGQDSYFYYEPNLNYGVPLGSGQSITITGRQTSDEVADGYVIEPLPSTLELLPVPPQYLRENEECYVTGQWGHAVTVHSCAVLSSTGW